VDQTPRSPALSTTTKSDGPIAQAAAWIVAIGLLLIGAHLFATPHDQASLSLRDLTVYQSAIDAFAAGGDPYKAARHGFGLFFTAPPFVWWVYKTAAHSGLRPLIGPILLAADAVSVAAIPLILGRLLLGPGLARAALAVGFFFAAFAGSGFFTALVINNGTPLYALIAVALIPAVTRDRWLAFHIAVALATAFKPYYAAFWIVPVLADGPWGRRWVESAIGLAAAAATYLAPAILAPKLMAEWLHALLRETVGVGLLGDNLLAAIIKAHHDKGAAYAAQLAFSAALMVAALLLGRLDRRQRIAGLIMIAVFLNPRAMRYDLSTAAVPLLALAAGAFAAAPAGLLVQTAWAVVLAGVTIVFSHSTPADGFLYAGVAVGALLVAIVGASGTSSRPRGEVGARREKVVGRKLRRLG
jgi:hypothetical protein